MSDLGCEGPNENYADYFASDPFKDETPKANSDAKDRSDEIENQEVIPSHHFNKVEVEMHSY